MFDNPDKELKKLEQQLLAAEKPEDDFEAFYQDILQEFGPASQTPPARKSSSSKKQSQKNAYTDQPKKTSKKSSGKKKKKKSLTGLVVTLCLECAGIVGIILWWLFRFL